jgi:DNA-binding MarR family transcriptional regulator
MGNDGMHRRSSCLRLLEVGGLPFMDRRLPLPALLSHALVAFTIEFDNEFEHQVPHRTTNHGATAGSRGAPWLVSRVMWCNFLRFIDEEGTTLRELQRRLRMPNKSVLNWVTRLSEWWGYLLIETTISGSKSKRMPPEAKARPTPGGRKALKVWQTLDEVVEQRWRKRLGEEVIELLRDSLSAIVRQTDVELSDGLPILGYGMFSRPEEGAQRAGTDAATVSGLSLASLLSRVLLLFATEFERESELSLAISASVVRLISEDGTPVRDLPRLSSVSKEGIATAVSFLVKRGYASLQSKSVAGGGKVLVLTSKGRQAQDSYNHLVWTIEENWQARFGKQGVRGLRESLERLAGEPTTDKSPLWLGLEPYPEGWRASVPRPAGLPHYPLVLHRGGFPDGS